MKAKKKSTPKKAKAISKKNSPAKSIIRGLKQAVDHSKKKSKVAEFRPQKQKQEPRTVYDYRMEKEEAAKKALEEHRKIVFSGAS